MRYLALFALLAGPALAENFIRVDADGRSYTLDTDSVKVRRELKPVSPERAAAKLPQWLSPLPGTAPDEVRYDVANGLVTTTFHVAGSIDELAKWYQQGVRAHGLALSTQVAGGGGQNVTGASDATIVTVSLLPDPRTGGLTVRASYMPRHGPAHLNFQAEWYDDSTGILRLKETSTGDEYDMEKRAILQANLNRPGAVESKGAGMPPWLPVYPGAMPSPKGRIIWLMKPTAEFITRDAVKQVYQYYLDAIRATGAKITQNGLSGSGSNGGQMHYTGTITAFKDDDKVELEVSEVTWMFRGLGTKIPDEKTGIAIRYMLPKR